MDVLKGILLKIASALLFAVMSALVRWVSDRVPVGQIVCFRSAFAILPVLAIYAWRGQLPAVVRTARPLGHVSRGLIGVAGMFLSFAALARLPLAEVTAIGFAAPLMTVALAALILKERVRVYRWSAVGVGFLGVLVMLSPYLNLSPAGSGHGAGATLGAIFALLAAFSSAAAVIQTRRLTGSETNSAIVFYFSLISAIAGLLTWPLGWASPSLPVLAALVVIGFLGGIAQILMTESFRLAPASVVAPFDYTAILWTVILGYLMFGEVPLPIVFLGAAIVVAAGLFVIFRERHLARQRIEEAVKAPAALNVRPDQMP
ncbi:MAG TPA: DMT family transporter [Xanthobacteraceae bacterium]|nr:DMT family transporter [Xanthobacteraceae bacterium]